MIIRAELLLPMSTDPVEGGAIRVEDGRITEVGKSSHLEPRHDEEVLEFPKSVLMPGMINAHCHLDYTLMRISYMQGEGFTKWIKRINAVKGAFGQEEIIASIAKGYEMLIDAGVTTVGNIEAYPDLWPTMPAPPIRTWWFLELMDLRSRLAHEESLLGALQFFGSQTDWPGGFGLSPHAPYTASIDLYRLAKRCSEQSEMLFTTHIAESTEEQEMFLYARGPLHDFLSGLGRDCSDCGHGSALSHLLEHGVLTEHCIAVHLNCMQEYDWQPLRESGASVAHCPKSHTYFSHPHFPMERMLKEGINVCIATDSMASNNGLDLRSEIREARARYPEIEAKTWMEMVTTNAAKALRQEGKLGQLVPGAWADLALFPIEPASDPYNMIIRSRSKPDAVFVQGKKLARV